MNTRALVGISLAMASLGIVWFALMFREPNPAPSLSAATGRSEPLSAASAEVENERSTNQSTTAARNQSIQSAVDQIDRVSNVGDLYADLLRRANMGDTSAMHALTLLAVRCASFSSKYGSRVHPRNELARVSMESVDRSAREQALQMMTEYCASGFAPGELSDRADEFHERLSMAAKNGDLHARAAMAFEGEEEDALVDAIQSASDPWVVEMALYRFARDNGPLSREISERVFPSHMRSSSPEEVALIRETAASWRACQLGRPCGANQFDSLQQCVIVGNCNMGRDVMTIIQQRELSGRQFDLMQRYLSAIDDELRRRG